MSKNNIKELVKLNFSKLNFKFNKYKPEVYITLGIIGFAGAVGSAIYSTTKAKKIIDEHNSSIAETKEAYEYTNEIDPDSNEEYSLDDVKYDKIKIYSKTIGKMAVNYLPSVCLFALSSTSILVAYDILKQRNIALLTVATALELSFNDYRKRVCDKYGKEEDEYFYTGVKSDKVKERVTDKNGEVHEATVNKVKNLKEVKPNVYSRFFDEGNPFYTKSNSGNLSFLMIAQAEANNQLNRDGYLFLNDLYAMLGFKPTKLGQCVGWLLPSETEPNYDMNKGYVDLGIFQQYGDTIEDERRRAFVNGDERSVLLNFNVEGYILDSLPEDVIEHQKNFKDTEGGLI